MKLNRRYIIVGSAIIVLALFISFMPVIEKEYQVAESQQVLETYYETEPYTETQEITTLVDRNNNLFSVSEFSMASGRRVFSTYIDMENRENIIISGYIRMLQGIECTLYVVGETTYSEHTIYSEYPPEEYYLALTPAENQEFSFVPDHSGTYYFVFTAYMPMSGYYNPEFNQFSAVFSYTEEITEIEEVTKYRDVTKQRTVTKEVLVTKTKRVSLLTYLITK